MQNGPGDGPGGGPGDGPGDGPGGVGDVVLGMSGSVVKMYIII